MPNTDIYDIVKITMAKEQAFPLGFRLDTDNLNLPPSFSDRMLITVRKNPTNLHYDPELVVMREAKPNGTIEKIIFGLTNTNRDVVVAPGIIRLEDRVNKALQFFSFGAEAIIKPQDEKCCIIDIMSRDATPILNSQNKIQQILLELAHIFLASKSASFLSLEPDNPTKGEREYQNWLTNKAGNELYAEFLSNINYTTYPELKRLAIQELQRLG